jgi:hypothetical protein
MATARKSFFQKIMDGRREQKHHTPKDTRDIMNFMCRNQIQYKFYIFLLNQTKMTLLGPQEPDRFSITPSSILHDELFGESYPRCGGRIGQW